MKTLFCSSIMPDEKLHTENCQSVEKYIFVRLIEVFFSEYFFTCRMKKECLEREYHAGHATTRIIQKQRDPHHSSLCKSACVCVCCVVRCCKLVSQQISEC